MPIRSQLHEFDLLSAGWSRMRFLLLSRWSVLLLLWLACTAYNLDKAYHIDDTAHLEIAAWITQHPGTPMTGLVNWSDDSQPIHFLNQPPLYFYLLAGWAQVFGYDEIAMHLLQSLFSLAAIIFFFKLAELFAPAAAATLTALFILSPAFFVGQNMMVDTPLIAVWLGFYYLLLHPKPRSEHLRYALAALAASAAILMKYSSLPLIPILALHIVVRGQRRCLYAALLPVAVLCGWSYFNYLEYGSAHILDRPTDEVTLFRLLSTSISWILTLGAIAPFSIAFMPPAYRSFMRLLRTHRVLAATVLPLVVTAVGMAFVFLYLPLNTSLNTPVVDNLLGAMFLVNGTLLCLMIAGALLTCARESVRSFVPGMLAGRTDPSCRYPNILNEWTVYYWLLSGAAFTILFSPFMATRHVLLSIPAVLLLLGRECRLGKSAIVSLGVTIFLTMNLAVFDWRFADYYRRQAGEIVDALPADRTVWFMGHWGWQWYARQSGMSQLESRTPEAAPGDFLVYPERIHQQRLNPDLILERIRLIPGPSMSPAYFSTAGGSSGARFYSSSALPWTLSGEPLGSIIIYHVKDNVAHFEREER